ncbi:MAG TPA: ABC transporter ATP-binding protein [Thermoanaerobaculia bacterium]|nr:ABC transporter ATP-binding protein [Thermoanaerobaculia bacterium]
MLRIESVDKTYPGGIRALCGFSLDQGPGILGLLGPNGAGKSTLMRILATVTRPTAGRVLWQGQDVVRRPQELRRVLGYLPQDFGIYPNLSAREFLEYLAAVKGLAGRRASARIAELLELVNLTAAGRRPLGSYSGGMRQRVGIAQALLNDPRLLIVDEPTVGLDPEERVRFRGLLSELAGERIVILSTHIVSDVEAAASEIAIIDRGSLLAHGTPEGLLRAVQGRVWEWTVPSAEAATLRRRLVVSGTARRGGEVILRVVGDPPFSGAAERAGAAGGGRYAPVSPTLEDAYLATIAAARADAGAA